MIAVLCNGNPLPKINDEACPSIIGVMSVHEWT